MAATAATQGVYSNVNTRKAQAEATDGNSAGNTEDRALTSQPASTARVETTCSLAMKPEIRAVANFQSPNPSGRKMTEMTRPTAASRLSAESAPQR